MPRSAPQRRYTNRSFSDDRFIISAETHQRDTADLRHIPPSCRGHVPVTSIGILAIIRPVTATKLGSFPCRVPSAFIFRPAFRWTPPRTLLAVISCQRICDVKQCFALFGSLISEEPVHQPVPDGPTGFVNNRSIGRATGLAVILQRS